RYIFRRAPMRPRGSGRNRPRRPQKGCRRYKWEFKDSNREFWLMGYAEVKLISLGCLIGSLMMFKGTPVHPHLTLIITMELSILIFFIIIYTFAIQRYTPFILWPISDLLNDLFSSTFLVGAAIFAVKSQQTMPMHYIYGVVSLSCWAVYLFRNHLIWRMVISP
uniref:CKLF like MARVEL transmembrane domain containing 2 n=1 Tax=Monodon monoceros TaxID=40151 RepID=A0A8C6F2Q2_MONMO